MQMLPMRMSFKFKKGNNMITLTPESAKEIQSIMDDQKIKNSYLRVGVRGGGCSGLSYILDLTENIKETDEKFENHGITVVCDPKSLLYMNGTTISFKDELMGRGFVFDNPNSTANCGCQSSFSV